ncbi:MAG: RluA family pseudouridine synthase [Candidatus Dadabacteria bacterium]|nr:MAG: RluA family pseudouridine synthase [Candidatus Dadabacteria bacterium]
MNNNKRYEGLDIIYEDDYLLAINKPSGIHSAMLPGEKGGESIAEILCNIDDSFVEASSKAEDCGLVNRLDFETSGILVAAKEKKAWIETRANVLAESVYKEYLCLTEGNLREEIEVDNYIGTPARRSDKVKVYKRKPRKKDRALPAKTLFSPVSYISNWGLTLVRVEISTGRRHQIRAHAAFAGYPLAGDDLYGSSVVLSEVIKKPAPKFFLHSYKMKFLHPHTKELITLEAPVPEPFREICEGVV